MQKVVSIFFLLVFVMVTFQDLTFYSLFKLNQEYLTEKFCVNKEKKELKCHASCHFSKQLKQSKKDQEKSATITERFEVNLFITDLIFETQEQKEYLKHKPKYLQNLEATYIFELLRPPKSV